MKVFASPIAVKDYDFSKFNPETYDKHNEDFYAELKQALLDLGYTGKLTGELVHYPMGDGAAIYMVADAKHNTILIHCPIGDAWHLPEWQTRGLRKSDIVKQIANKKAMVKLFGRNQ